MDKNIVAVLTKYNSNIGNIDRVYGVVCSLWTGSLFGERVRACRQTFETIFTLLGPAIIGLLSHMHSPSIVTQKKKGHCAKCIFQVKKLYFFVTDLARYSSIMIVSNSLRINFSLRWTLYKHRLHCLSFNTHFVIFLFSQADLLTKMESLVQTFNAIKSLQMSKQNGRVSADKSQIFSTWTIEQFCEYFLSHFGFTSNFQIWTTPSQWITLKQYRY